MKYPLDYVESENKNEINLDLKVKSASRSVVIVVKSCMGGGGATGKLRLLSGWISFPKSVVKKIIVVRLTFSSDQVKGMFLTR